MSAIQLFSRKQSEIFYLFFALLVWMLCFHATLYTMIEKWWNHETYTHGFLIFPIAIYLIYQKKHLFYITDKNPSFFMLTLLLMSVLLWSVARLVDVLVIQQLMVITMLPLIVASLFGFKLVKEYLFPFFYLLFAIPFGEFLVPKLQQITAVITVWGLEISQIPVFHEGMFISVPAGDFEVAVACSGIRYLIASMALGTLYAYLVYNLWWKKLIFIIAAFVVPIFANGVRAYGIVLIAQLSDMKYATGVDHLVYGWFFFGIVIFILFFIGSFWADKDTDTRHEEAITKYNVLFPKKLKILSLGVVLSLLFAPAYSSWMSYQQLKQIQSNIKIPTLNQQWTKTSSIQKVWKPNFIKNDKEIYADFLNQENKKVYFYQAEYLSESQGKELINSENTFYNIDEWVVISQSSKKIDSNSVFEYSLRSNSGKLLVWGWYEVAGFESVNPIIIKLIQAWAKLTTQDFGGRFTAIAVTYHDDKKEVEHILKKFYKQVIKKNS